MLHIPYYYLIVAWKITERKYPCVPHPRSSPSKWLGCLW